MGLFSDNLLKIWQKGMCVLIAHDRLYEIIRTIARILLIGCLDDFQGNHQPPAAEKDKSPLRTRSTFVKGSCWPVVCEGGISTSCKKLVG